MKRTVLLGLAALLVLGWGTTINGLVERPAEYRQLLQEAEQFEQEEIYVRAIECYERALKYQPDSIDLNMKIANAYLNMNDETSFISICNSVNADFHYPVETVLAQTDYYIGKKQNKKAIELLKNGLKQHKNSQELQERYETVKYTYTGLYLRYDQILPFCNDSAVVMEDGRYGLIDHRGKLKIKCGYDWLGPLSSDGEYVPVLESGNYYYASSSGQRMAVPKEGQKVEALGILCDGTAPAKINGAFGYINEMFEEQCSFQWEEASVIFDGVGAVKKEGAWALIDSDYRNLTDYVYEDVKCDEYGYCSKSGRIFAKTGDGYIMIDGKGNRVGTLAYQDAVPFITEEPTAVKIDGKWGYVNREGELVIEPCYEDAGPFSNGMAPVKQTTQWGYIDRSGEIRIDTQYEEAGSFYKGTAPVMEGNTWTAIELNMKG